MNAIEVRNVNELQSALENGATELKVIGQISGMPSLRLPEGVKLTGEGPEQSSLKFGGPGLRLSRDNVVENIAVETAETEIAIANDLELADAGELQLRNVATIGQVFLKAAQQLQKITVKIDGLHVQRADVRGREARPQGFGVHVLQGGLTLWNQQDENSSFEANLQNIQIGSEESPVRGSGVFIAGKADNNAKTIGGVIHADLVHTLDVFTDGGIAPGTPDIISGGVFVVSAAVVDRVLNEGHTVTFGQNDMVLDNWGQVASWESDGEVHSYGPSGIGFVNFGDITSLDMRGAIITEGPGARGFNLYDGTLAAAKFASIETFGNGSIGIQVSKPMGELSVAGDVHTHGGEGMSLVKGVQMTLKAIAVSIKPGGVVDSLHIGGSLITDGDDVVTFENSGEIRDFQVAGEIVANGNNSIAGI